MCILKILSEIIAILVKLIVFYSEESSKLISPKSFIVQYGYVILAKGE